MIDQHDIQAANALGQFLSHMQMRRDISDDVHRVRYDMGPRRNVRTPIALQKQHPSDAIRDGSFRDGMAQRAHYGMAFNPEDDNC